MSQQRYLPDFKDEAVRQDDLTTEEKEELRRRTSWAQASISTYVKWICASSRARSASWLSSAA